MDSNPEGISWIERAAIKTNNFDPDVPEQFWTHAILEVVINASCAHSYYNDDTHLPMYHPRGDEQRWNPPTRDAYVRYKYLTVMCGPDRDHLKCYQQVHGNKDYRMMRDSSVVGYVPVILHTKEEGKMYLDLTFPIRGIFFPLAQNAGPRYEVMCKYVRLDFKRLAVKIPYDITEEEDRLQRSVQKSFMSHIGMPIDDEAKGAVEDTSLDLSEGPLPLDEYNALCLERDVQFGLNYQPKWTIEFDVVPLVILLAIPRKDRNPDDNPYRYLKAITALSVRTPMDVTLRTDMEAGNYADLANVLKITQGVSFEYAKDTDYNFLPDLLNGLVTIGLSCIPVVGPLLACAEQIAYDAITDPDKFTDENPAGLTKDIIGAILDSARDAKDHINISKVSRGIRRTIKQVQFKTTKTAAQTYFKGSK
ncbi:MAG: hypothetical protein Q9215_007306 [Flavoplaca cf. flavocitrina]